MRDIENALESRRQGKRYFCPVCDPDCAHRPNLVIKQGEKGVYGKCFRCNKGFNEKTLLDALGIAAEYHSQVKIDRKHLTNSNAKVDKDEINLIYASSYPVIEDAEVLRKLQNWRGWSAEVIEKFGIRYLPQRAIFNFPEKYKSWRAGSYVNERGAKIFSPGWFLFPIFNKFGKIIYIKGRNFVTDAADKKYKRFKNTTGKMPFPYGMWLLKESIEAKLQQSKVLSNRDEKTLKRYEQACETLPYAQRIKIISKITAKRQKITNKQRIFEVIICEGETDTLSAQSNGLFAVGIPGANAFRQSWCKYFQNLNVCIAFDADEAGQNALKELIEQLNPFAKKVRKMVLPDDCNDYSDYFQNYSQDEKDKRNNEIRKSKDQGLTVQQMKFLTEGRKNNE